MNTQTKSASKSKTVWASLLTAIAGVVGFFHESTAEWLADNTQIILTVLGVVFFALRKVTKKPMGWLPVLAFVFFLPSCTAVDVAVDRSKRKSQTETHDIYPSDAVKPVLNAGYINEKVQKAIDEANESLSKATK